MGHGAGWAGKNCMQKWIINAKVGPVFSGSRPEQEKERRLVPILYLDLDSQPGPGR